jgi:hypothetical protein
MLVGKRRLGRTLLERHIVYDLMADGSPTGFIEYSADRDRIEIRGQRYSIASERKPMTLLERAVKPVTWRWKDVFAFRDDAGRLTATAEKSALNMFSLHHEAATFSIRPRGKGCLEAYRQRDGASVGAVEYRGVVASEMVLSLPSVWEPFDPRFRDVNPPLLCRARTPRRQQLARRF